jgi:HSP20 family protein
MSYLTRRNAGLAALDPFRILDDLFTMEPFAVPRRSVSQASEPGFVPHFDVKETKDGYLFKADLPGVKEEELEITLTGNQLLVSGKREAETRDQSERYFAYERTFGSFARAFTLPEGVDGEHVHAQLTNGVLELLVPKTPAHQPKKISIKTMVDKVKGALHQS